MVRGDLCRRMCDNLACQQVDVPGHRDLVQFEKRPAGGERRARTVRTQPIWQGFKAFALTPFVEVPHDHGWAFGHFRQLIGDIADLLAPVAPQQAEMDANETQGSACNPKVQYDRPTWLKSGQINTLYRFHIDIRSLEHSDTVPSKSNRIRRQVNNLERSDTTP